LPFERGSTMSDGQYTPSDGQFAHLRGRLFAVPDVLHKGAEDVILRAVQNNSGGALTVSKRCVSFSTGGMIEWGSKIDGIAGTGGEICKPIDDYYYGRLSTILANDIFYVVDEGLCDILSTADSSLEAAHVPVQMIGNGKIGAAKDKDIVIGTSREVAATTATSVAVCVAVNPGISEIGTSR